MEAIERTEGRSELRDILIVTVQYGNFSDTSAFVTSLASLEGSDACQLVIVDNDVTGAAAADLQALSGSAPFPVKVLRPMRNVYYWGGAALALDSVHDPKRDGGRWVIICNNDVTIRDPSFLRRLRSLDGSRYPIIAPAIVSLVTGRDQNPFLRAPAGRLNRLKWQVYDLDYRLARAMLAVHRAGKVMLLPVVSVFRRSPAQALEQRIYAPHGAFLILSSAFFARGGRLDTTVPMFAEELTMAALAQHLDLPVMYCPDLQVFHQEHSTTGGRLTPAKYELERRARRHYYDLEARTSRNTGED